MKRRDPRAPERVVVIGASAGGIDALRIVLGGLAHDFPAAVCVVQHIAPQSPGFLHEIFDRATPLRVSAAVDTQALRAGEVYVAPADRHLLVEGDRVRVTKGPRENRFRPAIDPLFRSAAEAYGAAAVGVILTGNLDDGAAGLQAIAGVGGTAIVQDPATATNPSMPWHALALVPSAHRAALHAIAPLLTSTVVATPEILGETAVSDDVRIELQIAKEGNPVDAGLERLGKPSSYSCPECHGVLLEMTQASNLRFRCHTGNAYSVASLMSAIDEAAEAAVWNAVRALEEGGLYMSRLAEHLVEASHAGDAESIRARGSALREVSEALRAIVRTRSLLSEARPDASHDSSTGEGTK